MATGGTGNATGATQDSANESIATQEANAQIAKDFQDQSSAINSDAQFAMKSDQLLQQLVSQIKVQ
jgi:hypothetical protein